MTNTDLKYAKALGLLAPHLEFNAEGNLVPLQGEHLIRSLRRYLGQFSCPFSEVSDMQSYLDLLVKKVSEGLVSPMGKILASEERLKGLAEEKTLEL